MKLSGKNPVLERLRTNPKSIRKVYMQSGFSESSYIHSKARKWGFPVYVVQKSKFQRLRRNVNTQGILVEVEDFLYTPYQELLEMALKKKQSLLFLDGLNDPQNLGAIIRSLACLGGFSIIFAIISILSRQTRGASLSCNRRP